MKKIEAIIRKTKFEEVKDALLEADIEWFSYYDVRGIGSPDRPASTEVCYMTPVPSNASLSLLLYATRMWKRQYKLLSKQHRPAKSATAVSSSFPSKTPFASAQENGVTSPSTMPNRKDKRQHSNHTNFIGRRAR